MENSQQIILAEIREMISAMYGQIRDLENRVGEIESKVVRAMETESEAVGMNSDGVQEEDITEESVEITDNEESFRSSLADKLESEKKPAVMDVMASKEAWRTDRPGPVLDDIRSAISLNDRVLFINSLFMEDAALFMDTVQKFNAMDSLDQVLAYIRSHFPEWNMESEVVYRFMMAVRRKLA